MTISSRDLAFLAQLTQAPSPSGYEEPAAQIFRERLSQSVDEVQTDVLGSVHGTLKGKDPQGVAVLLAGHIDQVGYIVTHVDDEGFVSFTEIGGLDPGILPGSQLDIHTRGGVVRGVVGRNPIHGLDPQSEEYLKVTPYHKLFIDVGLSKTAAQERIAKGDPITFVSGFEHFGGDFIASQAFDNKIGAWLAVRIVEEVRKAGGAAGDVIAAGTVQEEIGLRGAVTTGHAFSPLVAIAFETGVATDYPTVDRVRFGDFKCGDGPHIARGANINPVLFRLLVEAAEREGIPYQVRPIPGGTPTDANALQLAGSGSATALISVPTRYMHTPNEVLRQADLEATLRLVTRFILDLPPGASFIPW
ncbi:MAG: M20/M25/M40 family metallo-hydrolase [Coriobacteriales bacterium]|jgi:endoglucanase|nr:M20/M25/M40 family metallo-hydrolase [Coriobacteriales bacterium]